MFKIPNVTEANEMAKDMTRAQIMAFHYVSNYIIQKSTYNKNEAIEWRKAKDIEPSYLVDLERELNSLGFKMTVDYDIKKYGNDHENHIYMKIKVFPAENT